MRLDQTSVETRSAGVARRWSSHPALGRLPKGGQAPAVQCYGLDLSASRGKLRALPQGRNAQRRGVVLPCAALSSPPAPMLPNSGWWLLTLGKEAAIRIDIVTDSWATLCMEEALRDQWLFSHCLG